MTKRQKTIADKLDHPDLTYRLGVMDCWCYLYHELGKKKLADEMLDCVTNQRGSEGD